MELQNALVRFQEGLPPDAPGTRASSLCRGVAALLTMLAPFAPHMVEELWEMLGHTASVFRSPASADRVLALEEEVEVVVQVNGKVRAACRCPVARRRSNCERSRSGSLASDHGSRVAPCARPS